jgi:hypothetical protein
MKQRISQLFPVIALLVMTAAVYHVPIVQGGLIYGQDTVQQGYPLCKFKEMCLRDGTLSLWNPHMMSGLPQFASAPFYPTDSLVYFIDAADSVTWRYISHTFLAALFMFLFLRHLKVSRMSSLLGGVAFGFSGFFITKLYGGHGGAFNSGIWIPLVFLFLDRIITRSRLRDALGLGIVVGFQILGEHAQYVYYTMLACVGFALWRLWPVLRARQGRRIVRTTALTCAAIVMAFALSAAYLLPMMEITKLSSRSGGTGFEYATSLSLPPLYALSAFAANIWGSPARHNSVFGAAYWDGALYIGLAPLLLALYAAFASRSTYARFFRLLALVSFVLALGNYTPVYKLIYHFPGFSMMRAPSKILFIYTFAAAALSAFGLELLRDRAGNLKAFPKIVAAAAVGGVLVTSGFVAFKPVIVSQARQMIIKVHHAPAEALAKLDGLYATQLQSLILMAACAVVLAVLVWMLAYGRVKTRVSSAGIVALAMIELTIVSVGLIDVVEPSSITSFNSKQVAYLQEDQSYFRILPVEESTFAFSQGVLTGLHSVNGYYPINLRNYAELESAIDDEPLSVDVSAEISNYRSPLLNLLNVKYVLTHQVIRDSDLKLVLADDINIYWNPNALPRALIVHGTRPVPTPEDALREIQKPDFDARETVVLSGSAPNRPPQPAQEGEFARIISYRPLELVVDANLSEQGYLLLSEKYYPAWKAHVNGQPADMLTANYLFRAVELPAGRHTVRFAFESTGRLIGEKLTYSAFVVILLLFAYLASEQLRRMKRAEKGLGAAAKATAKTSP